MKREDQDGQIRQLLHLIDEAFDHPAWHGPNLRDSIRGLTVEQASWRPKAGRHNIWEIVVHCAYWKYAVRRRILAEKRGSFVLEGSNWFQRPIEKSNAAWRRDVELLEIEHTALRKAVSSLQAVHLKRKLHGSKWTMLQTISGIAAHDVYHAGQIRLLKRLQR
ncbi:MAG TPA: DinB family protein [Bacteroidota bacterium]|nr:DinB family protein [Bacteroidota bacterium]